MPRTGFTALLVGMGLAVAASAQTPTGKNACTLVTPEEAATILGPDPVKNEINGICLYEAKGQKMVLKIDAPKTGVTKALQQMPKALVPQGGGTVREEPGVGPDAYSTSIKGAQSIYMLKGSVATYISIATDAAHPFPDMLDKLRPIAKKALGRL
jgi:hypothetical protein